MSQWPKKRHGPELKCGGPGICGECTELRMRPDWLFNPIDIQFSRTSNPYEEVARQLDNGHANELVDDPNQPVIPKVTVMEMVESLRNFKPKIPLEYIKYIIAARRAIRDKYRP